MYIKVINPQVHGKTVFDNTGSCSRIVDYLNKENKGRPLGKKELFFNHEKDHIGRNEVIHEIDNNRKGIAAGRSRFHSLVIAPDQHELTHICKDPDKLKEYTKRVMEIYATHFKLGSGKFLHPEDIVWYAKLEHERNGNYKNGHNMHVHIIVSARDRNQKISLSPNTNNKKRFNRVDFALKSEKKFDIMFNYPRKESLLTTHQITKYASLNQKEKYFTELKAIQSREEIKASWNPSISILLLPNELIYPTERSSRQKEDERYRRRKRKKGKDNNLSL